jgi:class 3 adenylate cyclase
MEKQMHSDSIDDDTEEPQRKHASILAAMAEQVELVVVAYAKGTADDYAKALVAFDDALSEQLDSIAADANALRDQFAGSAMQGAFNNPIPATESEKNYIAEHAYRMADAMLKARTPGAQP